MKKIFVLIFILLFSGCVTTQQMAKLEQKVADLEEQVLMGGTERAGASFYPSTGTGLIGGTANKLDKIGSVVEKDVAMAALEDDPTFGDIVLFYVADDDSGATESVPFVIDPDEAGDIRWKLTKILPRAVVLYAAADKLENPGYQGTVITGLNAGENIAAFDLVYFDGTENEWMIADADAAGKFPARGIALAAGTNGNPLDVLIEGIVRNDTVFEWTANGATLYLDDVAGDAIEVAGIPATENDCIQVVGWSITNDEAYFHFDGHWMLVAAP